MPRKTAIDVGASDVISGSPVLQIDPMASGMLQQGVGPRPERPALSDAESGAVPPMSKSEMADSAIGRSVKAIAARQGGIGTVFISDVAKELGLLPEVLHEVLPALVKQGLVNVHTSSMAEGRMSPERLSGALTFDGKRYHTMSLAK